MLLIVIMAISSIIVFKNKKEDHKEEKIIEQVIDTAYKKDDVENTQMNNLQENNINMTYISSRPSRKSLGEYCFFIDFDGNVLEDKNAKAMFEVLKHVKSFKHLGSYPAYIA